MIWLRKGKVMGTTEPIRDKEDLKNFLNYYRNVRPSPRNYAMTVIGLHTVLRISDILNLKWKDVYHFQKNCFLKHICLCEKKTGKQSSVAMNQHVKEALTHEDQSQTIIFSRKQLIIAFPSAALRHTGLSKKRRKKPYAATHT